MSLSDLFKKLAPDGQKAEVDPNAIPILTTSSDYPTVFADAVWFASNLGNVVRITFLENLLEPANSPNPGLKARHVGTLAMPRLGFKNLVTYLTEMDALFDRLDREAQAQAETEAKRDAE